MSTDRSLADRVAPVAFFWAFGLLVGALAIRYGDTITDALDNAWITGTSAFLGIIVLLVWVFRFVYRMRTHGPAVVFRNRETYKLDWPFLGLLVLGLLLFFWPYLLP